MEKIIDIQNLTKTYGKARGVSNVSFSVEEGDIFGFLGPNGAGKSTTIRSMLGLIKYDSGSINILGMDNKTHLKDILKNVGYMPSEAQFYAGMKVWDVIKLAAEIRGVDCKEEALFLADRLKLDTGKKISDLSLGNRKKVSIVCAMQHKPSLFIFDEPTSGLDPLIQNTFFDLIQDYVKKGATCILSTHVLSEVKRNCNKVAIMKEGNLLCVDSVENLTRTTSKHIKVTQDGEFKEYSFSGDFNNLIADLGKHNISDLLIEEPSIDEIFMHYYQNK